MELNQQKVKKYMVKTLYAEDSYTLKRAQYNNVLYIYVYKNAIMGSNLILSVKVIALE
jgi:hypothetical protein